MEIEITEALTRQAEAMKSVSAATNTLGEVLNVLVEIQGRLGELRSNGIGLVISGYPDLLGQLAHVIEVDAAALPAPHEIAARQQDVRMIEQQFRAATGSKQAPGEAILGLVNDDARGAKLTLAAPREVVLYLRMIERQAVARVTPDQSPRKTTTLEGTLERMRDEDAINALRQVHAGAVAPDAPGGPKGSAKRLLEDVRQESIREQALLPEVKERLAPFTAPGLNIPHLGDMGGKRWKAGDKRPMSVARLREMGALNPTAEGVETLVNIGSSTENDRPHLAAAYSTPEWKENRELLRNAREMQRWLTEYGPLYVELHLLEP